MVELSANHEFVGFEEAFQRENIGVFQEGGVPEYSEVRNEKNNKK